MARGCGQLIAIGSILVVVVLLVRGALELAGDDSADPTPAAAGAAPTRSQAGMAPGAVPTRTVTPAPPSPTPTPVVRVSTVETRSEVIYRGEKHTLPEGLAAAITNVGLNEGDVLIGHGQGFMNAQGGCQVFLVAGPFNDELRITSGEWTTYVDQDIPSETAERMLQAEIASVRRTPGCSDPSITRLP